MNEVYFNGKLYKRYDEGLMFVITVLLGCLGVHRFLLKKYGTGLLWFFTCGLFFIGWIWDLITIIPKVRAHNAFVAELIRKKELEDRLLNQALANGGAQQSNQGNNLTR